MRKFRGDVKIVPTLNIVGLKRGQIVKTSVTTPDDMLTQKGLVLMQVGRADAGLLRKWVEEWQRSPEYPDTELVAEWKLKSKSRSLNQNALYWALVTVLAQEVYREHGWEEVIHEDILTMYAPRIKSKFSGEEVPKRSKHMDTREFTQLIEAVMYEINEHGITMTEPADMDRYWKDYAKIRFEGGGDHGYREDETLAQYRERVNYCEACRKYMRPGNGTYDGQLAHIVSRGASGEDETWNILHLCGRDHTGIQHQKGWDYFLKQYPHLRAKVEIAQKKHGEINPEVQREDELDIF